ncbi:MAG: acetate--CoA ligase [Motilibacteraceae bacterium]
MDARERTQAAWAQARRGVDGLPGGRGVNIAHEAVDRQVAHGHGGDEALRFLRLDGRVESLTYDGLRRATSRFADVLSGLGVTPGERVFTLAGRQPGLYVAVLGALRHRAVVAPLYAAFGPEPARQRITLGDGRVLVTTPSLYRRRIGPVRDQLPGLAHVLLLPEPGEAEVGEVPEGTMPLAPLMDAASDEHVIGPTDPEDLALLHFTSGTTGTPKGAMHVHGAVVAHHATAKQALDVQPWDVFWCTADPGWVTGTSYGIIAPLTRGATVLVDEGELDARRWYRQLAEQRVTVWYTAPTAIRMLMRAGTELAHSYDLSALRVVASVGEPLNAEAVRWGGEAFGVPVHDTWWQTETGAIMIASPAGEPVVPGSMGVELPGTEATVLVRGQDGRALRVDGQVRQAGPDEEGELALRPGWPSMFRGYLGDEQRSAACFAGGWYLTGDVVRRDAEGRFWFSGRADDVIKSAGHLIGPFEVESVLMEHPAVVEAGVIGVPDPVAGELVKAFVSLRPGFEPGEPLRRDILAHGRRRLGAMAPKEIAFDDHLPKTRSGKVVRRLLRARELGLPEGDLSTLEPQR